MAKDSAVKKRKASTPATEVEKIKKVKSVTTTAEEQPKKRKAVEQAGSPALKKSKAPKPKAEIPTTQSTKKTRSKSSKSTEDLVLPATISEASKKKKKTSSVSTSNKVHDAIPSDFDSDEEEEVGGGDEAESESDIDDQTEALLKGFESDGDEENDSGGLQEGQPVPKVPKLSKAEQKLLKAKSEDQDEHPGVVYVGRIPHGFYEYEMKEYFKQFGTILKLRLSRNRKTGASRHFAFIQFESATVADIVARSMDNYLLFGHILKVKAVADEQLSPDLWKGANKRFKKVPWNKLEGRRLKQGASEDQWQKRIEKESQRRADKQKKLEAIGYDFKQPALKSAKGLAAKLAVSNEQEEVKSIENGTHETASEPAAVDSVPKPAQKKGKRAKASTGNGAAAKDIKIDTIQDSEPKKSKKASR